MSFEMKGVAKKSFSAAELLAPLSVAEREVFGIILNKLKNHNHALNHSALCVFLIDKLHDEHEEELATGISIVVNKLVNEPFKGDRDILKSILETIMKAVAHIEAEK